MKKFLIHFLILAAMGFPVAVQAQQAIRINCGGAAYTDSKGQLWQADNGYNTGYANTVTANIAGTADQKLFLSERFALANGKPLIYSFPVTAGTYHVNLYFAETYANTEKVGARVFTVKLQGNTVFQNLDIFATVGANTALIKGADVIVTDGNINIEFDSVIQAAQINAIEITQTVAAPQLNLRFLYPDGSPVAGTLNYKVTSGTTGGMSLAGNQPLSAGQVTCMLISSPQVLGLVGTMNVNLSLTDTAGHTLWQIVLSMNPATANFTAVQSSTLNVVVQKQ